MDRIRKTSTDDEENISQDEESAEGSFEGELTSPSLRLSMESLLECLKNAAEIESEHGKLGENDNVRKAIRVIKCVLLSQYLMIRKNVKT